MNDSRLSFLFGNLFQILLHSFINQCLSAYLINQWNLHAIFVSSYCNKLSRFVESAADNNESLSKFGNHHPSFTFFFSSCVVSELAHYLSSDPFEKYEDSEVVHSWFNYTMIFSSYSFMKFIASTHWSL